jgi:hypothetical protein
MNFTQVYSIYCRRKQTSRLNKSVRLCAIDHCNSKNSHEKPALIKTIALSNTGNIKVIIYEISFGRSIQGFSVRYIDNVHVNFPLINTDVCFSLFFLLLFFLVINLIIHYRTSMKFSFWIPISVYLNFLLSFEFRRVFLQFVIRSCPVQYGNGEYLVFVSVRYHLYYLLLHLQLWPMLVNWLTM